MRAIDLRKPQAWLHRRGDLGGEMLLRGGFVARDAVGAVCPELTAGFGVDQPDVRRACEPDPLIAPVK